MGIRFCFLLGLLRGHSQITHLPIALMEREVEVVEMSARACDGVDM